MVDKKQMTTGNDRVPLRDYVDVRFDAICKEIETGNKVMDARLEKMNEFRSAMTDQAQHFMTVNEYHLAHKPVEEDIKELRDFMAKQQGKASQTALLFVSAISILGLVFAIVDFFLRK